MSNNPSNGKYTEEEVRNAQRMVGKLVDNAILGRTEVIKRLLDPRRNFNNECGYPETENIKIEDYQQLYDREAIAARIVELFPRESWQVTPTVYEIEDSNEPTKFEQAWDNIGRQLRGEQSYYQDEEGSPIWGYLKAADILSGIGQYGVILIGIDDGLELSQPANGIDTKDSTGIVGTDTQYYDWLQRQRKEGFSPEGKNKKERRILFLRVFPESLAEVATLESNLYNPRFGQPVLYRITFIDPNVRSNGIGLAMSTLNVHWTRVIHIADTWHQPSSSMTFAVPRLRSILNRVLDLRKLYGGSAEMYWRGAFPGYSLETPPQLGIDTDVDDDAIRNAMENLMNGLQRWIRLTGLTAKSLAPQVVDPTPQIKAQLEAISIRLGIPMRKLLGSERGELASSQDDGDWNDRIVEREDTHNTPNIIVPMIDRLIYLGVLPKPEAKQPGPDIEGGNRDTEGMVSKGTIGADESNPFNPTERSRVANRRTVRKRVRVVNADGEEKEIEKVFRISETDSGYSISWPDITKRSEDEKAGIFLKRAQAFRVYVDGNLEMLIGRKDFLTREGGFTEEEAETIIENAKEELEEHIDFRDEMGLQPDGSVEEPNPFDPDNPDGSNPFDKEQSSEDEEDIFAQNEYLLDRMQFLVTNYHTHNTYGETTPCILVRGICFNCGGEGGKPGPCPEGKSKAKRAKGWVEYAVGATQESLLRATVTHPSMTTPSASTSQALGAIIHSLTGDRPVSMAAATVILGIAPTALVGMRRGLRWLLAKSEEGAEIEKKGNKEQRTKRAHEQRKGGRSRVAVGNQRVIEVYGHLFNSDGICLNCGGEGSGIPGPCPTGQRKPESKPERTRPTEAKEAKGTVSVPEKKDSEKSARAKAAYKMVNEAIQRYSEEVNERRFATAIGGESKPDNEPIDVETKTDGIEMKTMVDNDNDKLTMDSYAQIRKVNWERETGKTFHTIVSDDRLVYNAKGEGKHDDSKRVYFYRRGIAGSARVGTMHRVVGEEELKKLMAMDESKLPKAARRTDGKHMAGTWEPVTRADGRRGFRNTETKKEFWAKK